MANDVLDRVRRTVSAARVFTEPVERGGATVIGVARVFGGGGGGEAPDGTTGGGLGLAAMPVGAYVIRDGRVRWIPAVDVNMLVLTAGVVVLIGLALRNRRAARAAREND